MPFERRYYAKFGIITPFEKRYYAKFGVITPFERRYYATFGVIMPFERRYFAKFGIITPFERRYNAFFSLLCLLRGVQTHLSGRINLPRPLNKMTFIYSCTFINSISCLPTCRSHAAIASEKNTVFTFSLLKA